MIYPFLYQVIKNLDSHELKNSIFKTGKTHEVWNDWILQEVESAVLRSYIETEHPSLRLLFNRFFISKATMSNFHIDRFHYFHLSHRILIPFDNSFHYEWIVNNEIVKFFPEPGQVILFNNMIPHRFVVDKPGAEAREALYFDLIHPDMEPLVKTLEGTYSKENEILEKMYGRFPT